MQNLIKIYHVVQELWAFSLTDHDRPDWCSTKPRHLFAYQCQSSQCLKVELCKIWSKYTMRLKRLKDLDRPEASSPFGIPCSRLTMLKCISSQNLQNLIQIYHVVHFYLLTTIGRTDVQQSLVHQKRLLRMSVVRQSWHAQACKIWSKYTMWLKSCDHFH